MEILVSIITINYNNKDGLAKTLDSVRKQDRCPMWEYIVVDGASKDGSVDLLEKNEDIIDRYVTEPDKGIYEAMNKGVRMASGEYCLFLNSGDSFHSSDTLANVLPKLSGEDVIIGKDYYLNAGRVTDNSRPITFNRFYLGSVPHQASFIRRSLLLDTPYDESFRIVSDWKFFVQKLIVENCPYRFIDDVIADFDCDGISSTNKMLCERERKAVLDQLFPPRMILDYQQFNYGHGYEDSDYDRFFIKLRDFKYANVLYTLDVLIMRLVALFKKGARFSRNYPIFRR